MHRIFYETNRFSPLHLDPIALRGLMVHAKVKVLAAFCLYVVGKTVQSVSFFQFSKHVFFALNPKIKSIKAAIGLNVIVHCLPGA